MDVTTTSLPDHAAQAARSAVRAIALALDAPTDAEASRYLESAQRFIRVATRTATVLPAGETRTPCRYGCERFACNTELRCALCVVEVRS